MLAPEHRALPVNSGIDLAKLRLDIHMVEECGYPVKVAVGGVAMDVQRQHWPLTWTATLRAGYSRITIFDLVELRSTVDTHRAAIGLSPVSWIGRTDDDPTFVAGRTRIRAVHFTQLREAVAELYGATDLGRLPEFSGGPVVPNVRLVKLSDILDLRGWVERYEVMRPQLAARVVRRFGTYSVPGLSVEWSRNKLTELWDSSGLSRYFYGSDEKVHRIQRVIDSHAYWTSYEYDAAGRLIAVTYPDSEEVTLQYDSIGSLSGIRSDRASVLGERIGAMPSSQEIVAEVQARTGETAVRFDARGRPVLVGDPATPVLRLVYDGDGRVVKRLDAMGTVHIVGEHCERNVGTGSDTTERITKYVPDRRGGRWHIKTPTRDVVLDRFLKTEPGSGVSSDAILRKSGVGDTTIWRMPDEVWKRVQPHLSFDRSGERTRQPSIQDRETLDAIFHVFRTGSDWMALPHDLGKPANVHGQFVTWRRDGVFQRLARVDLGEFEILKSLCKGLW